MSRFKATEQGLIPFTTEEELEADQRESGYLAQKELDLIPNAIKMFTDITTNYIEAKVQAYNIANGLAFKDIDAFTKYTVTPTSSHNAIANQFITYADKVWLAARAYQSTATTIPTEAEFVAVLDSVVF